MRLLLSVTSRLNRKGQSYLNTSSKVSIFKSFWMAQVRRKNTEVLEYIQVYPIEALECHRFITCSARKWKWKKIPQLETLSKWKRQHLSKRSAESQEFARQFIKVQEENKRTYKKRKVPPQYNEGDLVAIKRTQDSPELKLAAKYLIPYGVKKTIRNDISSRK